jgi:hypothetical protein
MEKLPSLINQIAEGSVTSEDGNHQLWTADLQPRYGFPIVYNRDGRWVDVRKYLNGDTDKVDGYVLSYRSSCQFRTCIHPDCRAPSWALKDGWHVA